MPNNRHGGDPNNVLHDTVKLLFMNNDTAATQYLNDNPTLNDFKFYVHNLPPGVRTVEHISECIEQAAYDLENKFRPNLTKEEFLETYCDWSGRKICNSMGMTEATEAKYSTRRLNDNIDAVVGNLLVNHYGKWSTANVTEAIVKVVPFPRWSNGKCHGIAGRTFDESMEILLSTNWTKMRDHLFLMWQEEATFFVERDIRGRGEVIMPYVNANAEYQPPDLAFGASTREVERFFSSKKYALAAVFSINIAGRGDDRKEFAEKADAFFGNGTTTTTGNDGTIGRGNGTLGGMPVVINVMRSKRQMVGEAHTMQLYRDSIFCPSFRGDMPSVRRIMDTILSGCIPVVLTHYWKDGEKYKSSYFANKVAPNSNVLPWARGSFGTNYPSMGIDYSELVVEIDAKECGVECIPSKLEELLKDKASLWKRKHALAKYARLLSYGLEHNEFRYVDAMSALLVATRHHILHM